jgi:hypothetical protein
LISRFVADRDAERQTGCVEHAAAGGGRRVGAVLGWIDLRVVLKATRLRRATSARPFEPLDCNKEASSPKNRAHPRTPAPGPPLELESDASAAEGMQARTHVLRAPSLRPDEHAFEGVH